MPKKPLDHTDILILNILQKEAELSNIDLSKRIGLAASSTLARVNKLKELRLLPSAHYVLNKEALGYKELFLLKISLRFDAETIQKIEEKLLKDSLVEQLWSVAQKENMGTVLYKGIIRAKNDEDFRAWCQNISANYACVLEYEKIEILIKERSHLKLKHSDLDALRKLDEAAND